MSDLAVAHLPLGQADCFARRLELRVRPTTQQATPVGHARLRDRVIGRPPAESEAVNNDQDERSRPQLAAARRACAVNPARATMPAISSTFRLAPPTSAPSLYGYLRRSTE